MLVVKHVALSRKFELPFKPPFFANWLNDKCARVVMHKKQVGPFVHLVDNMPREGIRVTRNRKLATENVAGMAAGSRTIRAYSNFLSFLHNAMP
jgi:hypothetical protein